MVAIATHSCINFVLTFLLCSISRLLASALACTSAFLFSSSSLSLANFSRLILRSSSFCASFFSICQIIYRVHSQHWAKQDWKIGMWFSRDKPIPSPHGGTMYSKFGLGLLFYSPIVPLVCRNWMQSTASWHRYLILKILMLRRSLIYFASIFYIKNSLSDRKFGFIKNDFAYDCIWNMNHEYHYKIRTLVMSILTYLFISKRKPVYSRLCLCLPKQVI